MDRFDVAIVGGGVVGLAVAHDLVDAGARTVVLERHPAPGLEQSTHNSQVIHSGAFLRPGSLRASLARDGGPRLYRVADELGVHTDRCGTLVVAIAAGELPRLEQYVAWARANGVERVEPIDDAAAHVIEPALAPVAGALWLPTGGRVDATGLVRALERNLRTRGGRVRCGFDVVSARHTTDGWTLSARSGDEVGAPTVINSAGVESGRIAECLESPGHRVYPCLGEYARVIGAKRQLVSSMVYGFPPPGYPGIGTHLTRQVNGDLLIGPTATYLDSPALPLAPVQSLEAFAQEARRLVPGIEAADLEHAGAGIRAKTVAPGAGEAFGDFLLREEPTGSGAFHLVGVESPGLTASFAVAQRVVEWWRERRA